MYLNLQHNFTRLEFIKTNRGRILVTQGYVTFRQKRTETNQHHNETDTAVKAVVNVINCEAKTIHLTFHRDLLKKIRVAICSLHMVRITLDVKMRRYFCLRQYITYLN